MSGSAKIKAWLVQDKCDYYGCATVVFAETRGKAKSIALHTVTFSDSSFIDLIVLRLPVADKMYSPGKQEMDWYNKKDRSFLMKECGFVEL